MAIKPVYDKCGKELTKFGAILLSPPKAGNTVIKYHLCQNCYKEIVKTFKLRGGGIQ